MEEADFAAFYESTYRPLWAYVAKSVGEPAVADDIAQEAYVRMLQIVKRGTRLPEAKAYLYRIATNLMHDHWRRGGREVHEGGEDEVPMQRGGEGPIDLGLDVNQAFARLAPRERALLWLAYVEGYAHRDIAGMMNVGEGSVRVLLFRARNRLLDLFRRMGIESGDVP
jgi:RNA polymerase sigma-70 factor (ECF subfamily)